MIFRKAKNEESTDSLNPWQSIGFELLTLVFSVYFLVTLTVTGAHITLTYLDSQKNINEALLDLSVVFAPGIAQSLWNEDDDQIRSILSGMKKIPMIKGFKVENIEGETIEAGGRILTDSNSVQKIDLVSGKAAPRSQAFLEDMIVQRVPLIHEEDDEENETGALTLYSDTRYAFGQVKDDVLIIIVNAIIKTTALWYIFLWFAKRRLSRPLGVLASATQLLRLDDLSQAKVDTNVKKRNEIKVLEEGFNEMVQKLINAREELIKLNKNLEQKVIERTKELELESAASNLKTQEIFVQQTQLEQTQSQLIQAEKLASLGTLVAGVAHEINNPLNFVSISARTLDKELREHKDFLFQLLEGEHEIKKILEPKFDRFFEALIDVNEGGERIKVIVRDLRTFSRLDEEGAEEADVTAGLPSTLRLIKTQYKKDIDFVCDFQAEAILACWPTQLDQVYLNIMSNACQSIQEKQENAENMGQGILTIRTFFPKHKHAGTHLGISFSDTGCGMTDQVISKIFEPFFTTKGVGEGTGMGMSISYGIIEKHNGHIEVESTVGEGTTITILLPLQRKTADPGRGN